MNRSRILALTCALLVTGSALAESDYDFDATVVCVHPAYVTADIGGTVASVPVLAGEKVESGDVIAELNTTKIYATTDGTVTGVFAEAGDSVSAITDRYGALMYIEPASKYTIAASTANSYNASANKYVHVGEHVYLSCTSDGDHTGEGFVSAVSGEDFTVEVTSGSFYMGETVSVFREDSLASKTRIGRGEIERIENVAVTGGAVSEAGTGGSASSGSGTSASVVQIHVADGDTVKAGDLLIETLSGEYDALYCTGTALTTDQEGILAEVNASVGNSVNKGDIIATLYPQENLQLKIALNESDLSALAVGDAVQISFNWNEDADDASTYTGTVSEILYTAVEGESLSGQESAEGISGDSAAYAAYIDFEAGEEIRLGMTAIVSPANAVESTIASDNAE